MLSAYIISYYILNGKSDDIVENKAHIFTLYLYSILMILSIINNLLPLNFTFIDLFQFYLVYLIYKGVDFLGVKSDDRWKFVVIASLALLLPIYSIKTILEYILL